MAPLLLQRQAPCRLAQQQVEVSGCVSLLCRPLAGPARRTASRAMTRATRGGEAEPGPLSCRIPDAEGVVCEPVATRQPDVPSSSGSAEDHWLGGRAALALAAATGLSLLLVDAAWASGGTISGGALDLFKDFLDQVEAMGPMGAFVFVLVVMLSEMIPLFPTQPLSLASGMLFGGKQGAILMLIGVTLAALNAFVISRGIGRGLAEKVISMEMGEEPLDHPGAANHNLVARKLAEVQRTIETGTFSQQLIAVALLRLTPVVPFSASNYVLGLTPLQLPAFAIGTVAGMSVWAVLYASLGGVGRNLLENGVDMAEVFTELAEQSGAYTKPVLLGAGVLAAGAAVFFTLTHKPQPAGGPESPAGTTSSASAPGSSDEADQGVRVQSEQQLMRK